MAKNNTYAFVFFLLLVFVTTNISSYAQEFPSWYLVSLKDKNNNPYDLSKPSDFLSSKAIERRQKANIAIDSTDLPINPNYVDSLVNYGLQIFHKSNWLNAVLVYVEDANKLSALNSSTIVDSVAFMAPFGTPKIGLKNKGKKASKRTQSTIYTLGDIAEYTDTKARIFMVELDMLLNMGYNGEGIEIAVFDNGFSNVDIIPAFAHLYQNNQLLGTRNFTNDGKKVYKSGSHGTNVLSTMAAYVENEFLGSALGASYYLFQTEDNRSEYPIEEANWLFAAEYADSLGVDIITSSLVYTRFDSSIFNHNHGQLNGQTAIVSRAAYLAAKKGILVFQSAGNEGDQSWQKICFPSDALDVITVGAVDEDELIADFSSKGNSADGRIKPDITAMGKETALINGQGNIIKSSGTSYSTPFVAGAAATLMQASPNNNAAEVRNAILQSARQYESPDSLLGYGLPNFYLAAILLQMDTISKLEESKEFWVIPNPFNSQFRILFSTSDSEQVDISVYDMSGKLLWLKENLETTAGKNFYQIDQLNDLAQGLYFVNIQVGEKRYSKKIIKQ